MRACFLLGLSVAAACGSDSAGPDAAVFGVTLTAPTGEVRVLRDDETILPITVARSGVGGEVRVEATGLPTGVTAEIVTIPVGEDQGEITLVAAADVVLGVTTTITLTAEATQVGVTDDAAVELFTADVPGAADVSFDGDGRVTYSLDSASDRAFSSTFDAAGNLVVAAYVPDQALWLLRFTPDGELDDSFGAGGVVDVTTSADLETSLGHNVIVRDDGSILVAYRNGTTAEVAAYTDAGDAIAAFGDSSGKLVLSGGDLGGTAQDVQLVRDAAGAAYVITSVTAIDRVVVTKLTVGGSPDPGFGTAGSASVSGAYNISDALIDAQGRFVLAGSVGSLSTDRTLVRLTPAGELDDSFGGTGVVTLTDGAGNSSFLDVTELPDGGLAATGYFGSPRIHVFTEAGALRTSFDDDGVLAVALSLPQLRVIDGDLFVVGGSGQGFEAWRLSLSTGALVTSFGIGGIAKVDFGAGTADVSSTLVDDLGRLVISGARRDGGDDDVAIARMWL